MANSKDIKNEQRALKYELQEFNYDADFGMYNRYKVGNECCLTTPSNSNSANFSKYLDLPELEPRTTTTALSVSSLADKYSHSSALAAHAKMEEIKKKKQAEKEQEKKLMIKQQNVKMLHEAEDQQDSKKKCGLRALSNKVRILVNQNTKLTYKQVAEIIVEQQILEFKQQNEQYEMGRQTKNIKRRVYDALSVLINTQILSKQDRFVVPTEESRKTGKRFAPVYPVIRDLENDIAAKKKNCQNKILILKHLFQRYAMIKSLISRNKASPINSIRIKEREKEISRYLLSTKEATEQQDDGHKHTKEEQRIVPWPFIAIRVPKGAHEIRLYIDKSDKAVQVSSAQRLQLEADLDLISNMRHLPQRMMTEFENQVNEFINCIEDVENQDKKKRQFLKTEQKK